MNTTGCPAAFATDQMFQHNTPLACDTPLVAFYIYIAPLYLLNLIRAGRQFYRWFDRRRRGESESGHNKRIPWGPLNTALLSIDELLLLVLGGLNIANFTNGGSLALYSLGYMLFAVNYSYGLIMLVRLGERILPRGHRESPEARRLAKFDGLGKSLILIQLFSMIASSIALVILGPIIPQYEDEILVIGFALKAFYIAVAAGSYIYHFQRCINIVWSVQQDVIGMRSGGPNENLMACIARFRKNQLLHIIISFPSALILILICTRVVPASIWLVTVPAALECIGTFIYEMFVGRNRMTNCSLCSRTMRGRTDPSGSKPETLVDPGNNDSTAKLSGTGGLKSEKFIMSGGDDEAAGGESKSVVVPYNLES